MMAKEKNRLRNAGDGGPLGTRPRYGIASTVVFLIMSFGLYHCAEETNITRAPVLPSPTQPQSQLEKAKSILGVTDQPSGYTPVASQSHKSQDIRKIIASMKRKQLVKKSQSEASVSPDTHTDTATASQTSQGLIKSILRAVSHAREGDKEDEAKENLLSATQSGKHADEDTHSGAERKIMGKEKIIKAISKVVLSGNDPVEQLEQPTSLPAITEEVKDVSEKMDTKDGTSNSEVPYKETVMKIAEKITKSASVESVGGGDGGSIAPVGDSEGKKSKSEVIEKTPDTDKEEEAGGADTPTVTTEGDGKGVQPVGSGIEVVTEALGVLDVQVATGPGNSSISPASAVDTRQNTFSKKSEVTLSHIFGAKEFFKRFPAENFTYLRTHWNGSSKPSLENTTTSVETEPLHKSEPAPEVKASEPVEGKTEVSAETVSVTDSSQEVSSSGTEKKDERESPQKSLESETVPPAIKAVEGSVMSSAEGKEPEQAVVDEGTQQHKTESQVQITKKDESPSQPSSVDLEAKKETQHPPETSKPVEVEVQTVTETHQTPSSAPESLEEPTKETQTTEALPAPAESKNVSEETVGGGEEQEVVVKVDLKVEEAPDEAVKEQVSSKEKEKDGVVTSDVEEDKDKPAVDSDTPEETIKKKKKTSEPEKVKKEAADKSVDAKQAEREKTADTLETYSQFTQRVNAEKKNGIISNGHGTNGHGKGPKVKTKNYASPDCGSKLMAANPEASHASKVIHSNKDEYLLNKCRDKTWFVIELCESIRPQKFDIANFELFSNLPKDIHVLGSHRYPSREWTPIAWARGQEGNRGVQSFPVEIEDFFKYIKVEVNSHYGSEFFCPISLFRIYGLSEFEVIDTAEEPEDPEDPEEPEVFYETKPDEKWSKEEGKPSVIPAVIKNMFSGVLDVIKRGYRPHSASSEPGDSCYTLQPTHAVDKRSCQLADSLNYILSCYHAEYQVLMQQTFVSNIVKNSGFCRQLASTMCLTPEVSDGVVYDTVCNSSYLCIMLSPKHMLAMCFMHDSHIVNSQVECESAGTLLPENFSATSPHILPAENRMPSYVKNAKINTSTITRTDATIPNMSSNVAQTREGMMLDQENSAKQIPIDQVVVSPEEVAVSPTPDGLVVETSKPKKAKASGGSQDRVVKEEEQPDNTTEPEERVEVEGSGVVGLELGEEENTKEGEAKQEEEVPLPVTPLPVEPKLSSTSPTNKESVVVRLSNKIKALEYNMSISSQYLEELSRWYKSQMEEMQRQFNLTIAALNATSRKAYDRDQHHQRDIETLEEQLARVTSTLEKLVEERENLAHTVVEQHLLLMVVEVVVLCVVFVLCHKRTTRHRMLELEGQERRAQTPSEDPSDRQALDGSNSGSGYTRGRMRRRSVDSITRERLSHQRRCRRPSEEALRISGTYQDLLIIEPAIPIMVDSVSDRKKKRKSSSGVLKRSKSNASIVEKSCNSTRISQRMENLDMSSAGVLFCGDQVDAKGTASGPQAGPVDSQLPGDPHKSLITANISSRSYVEEVMPVNHPRNDTSTVTLKKHSAGCSQNSDNSNRNLTKLTKSHSISCAPEKLRNGTERKKTKKIKKKNSSQESQQDLIHESDLYPQTSRTSYNGQSEHNLEYHYNGRSSVHFSETAHALGNHMYSADVTNGSSYVNGDSLQDLGYVGSDYIHSSYMTNFSEKRRTSPAAKVKLRSDNWEWYSLQHFGSSSETVSNCSDSSGRTRKGRHDDVPHTVEQSDDKKIKKKKKSKSKSPVVLEEETNGT